MQAGDEQKDTLVSRLLNHEACQQSEQAATEAPDCTEHAPHRRHAVSGKEISGQCKEHGTLDLNGEQAKTNQGQRQHAGLSVVRGHNCNGDQHSTQPNHGFARAINGVPSRHQGGAHHAARKRAEISGNPGQPSE